MIEDDSLQLPFCNFIPRRINFGWNPIPIPFRRIPRRCSPPSWEEEFFRASLISYHFPLFHAFAGLGRRFSFGCVDLINRAAPEILNVEFIDHLFSINANHFDLRKRRGQNQSRNRSPADNPLLSTEDGKHQSESAPFAFVGDDVQNRKRENSLDCCYIISIRPPTMRRFIYL